MRKPSPADETTSPDGHRAQGEAYATRPAPELVQSAPIGGPGGPVAAPGPRGTHTLRIEPMMDSVPLRCVSAWSSELGEFSLPPRGGGPGWGGERRVTSHPHPEPYPSGRRDSCTVAESNDVAAQAL